MNWIHHLQAAVVDEHVPELVGVCVVRSPNQPARSVRHDHISARLQLQLNMLQSTNLMVEVADQIKFLVTLIFQNEAGHVDVFATVASEHLLVVLVHGDEYVRGLRDV